MLTIEFHVEEHVTDRDGAAILLNFIIFSIVRLFVFVFLTIIISCSFLVIIDLTLLDVILVVLFGILGWDGLPTIILLHLLSGHLLVSWFISIFISLINLFVLLLIRSALTVIRRCLLVVAFIYVSLLVLLVGGISSIFVLLIVLLLRASVVLLCSDGSFGLIGSILLILLHMCE